MGRGILGGQQDEEGAGGGVQEQEGERFACAPDPGWAPADPPVC